MARIRSIHPGIFTDEAYMALSFPARELVKGIWCEADDHGVFEWKPLTLKARILPADAVDLVALLGELVENRFVVQFEVDGRQFGAVRNFVKYQRPKKPSYSHPLPDECRTLVGLKPVSSEPSDDESGGGSEPNGNEPASVGNQFRTGGGKSPQMEEGVGGGGKGERESIPPDIGGDSRARARPDAGRYAFAGRVIRLTQADFDAWKSAYHAIPDLRAELTALDAFYAGEPEDKRGRWFIRCATALAKKHQERISAQSPPETGSPRRKSVAERAGITPLGY